VSEEFGLDDVEPPLLACRTRRVSYAGDAGATSSTRIDAMAGLLPPGARADASS